MSGIGKLSREDYRRQKDLEAARKAGTAPAEVDEDGNMINPHTPAFISQAPWYLDTGKPGLKHQKAPKTAKVAAKLDDWYQRGTTGQSATKYRKGACENCGAATHKTKDCLERPRKKGAKWTGKDIAPDEVSNKSVEGLTFNWDAKRDRWNGYDPAEHKKRIEEFEAVEAARQKLREEEIDKQTSTDLATAKKLAKKEKKAKSTGPTEDGDFGSSDEDEEDADKYADKADMAGQKVDTSSRMTVRNLRIREDRAKYLYNLNPDSAYYDPKSRSMREAPDPNVRPEDAVFAGDNFHRAQGDAAKMQQLQLFAWQSESRGNDVHLQANPTINELQHREFQQKKEKLRESTRGSILERYGGAEHFDSVPKELLTGQTENYVEYSKTGQPVRPMHRIVGSSTEPEKTQLYDGNHTAPWASWYDEDNAKYGYACCHSSIRNSYCTGKKGIEAAEESANLLSKPAKQIEDRKEDEAGAKGKAKAKEEPKRRRRSESVSSASSYSSSSSYSSDSGSESDGKRRRKHRRSTSSRRDRHSKKSSSSKRRRRSSSSSSDDDREARRSSDKKREAEGYKSTKGMGEGDVSSRLDRSKLRAALAEESRRQQQGSGSSGGGGDAKPEWLKEAEELNRRNKEKYASLVTEGDGINVSEEQLEAYRMLRRNDYEDPMANPDWGKEDKA